MQSLHFSIQNLVCSFSSVLHWQRLVCTYVRSDRFQVLPRGSCHRMRPRAQDPVITTAAAKTTAASTAKAEKGNEELLLVMVKHNGLQRHCVGGDDDGDDEHTD